MSVTDKLTRLTARNSETEPEDNIVQTAFELFQQLSAGYAFGPGRVLEVVPELAFLGEVNALGFLFFAQLETVAYNFGLLIFPVLSGGVAALLDGTFVAEALGAFQEELNTFPAA
jgi:hypothetical protein